jgi:hypothetical protein
MLRENAVTDGCAEDRIWQCQEDEKMLLSRFLNISNDGIEVFLSPNPSERCHAVSILDESIGIFLQRSRSSGWLKK